MVKATNKSLAVKTKKRAVSKPSKVTTRRGAFITLEGGEGTGKSTQMQLLQKRLSDLGHEVVTSREPGGSVGGEAVRHVLLSGAAEPFGAEMEAILFSASRADHVDTLIEPALRSGKTVICDRFFDSTRVYQGVSGKVSQSFVRHLEQIACGETWPDLTIIIDLDPKVGMQRAQERRDVSQVPDRFEKESLKLQELRRKAYLEIASEEPERCIVVDGSGSADEVFARIWAVVEDRLALEGMPEQKTESKASANKAKSRKPKLLSHKQLTKAKTKGAAKSTKTSSNADKSSSKSDAQ